MRVLHGVLLVLLVGVTLVFCIQNLETYTVHFLGWSARLPFPVLVIIVYLLGMVSGWSVLSFLRKSLRELTDTQRDPVNRPS
jgi:uncharacterized integral membrane protein